MVVRRRFAVLAAFVGSIATALVVTAVVQAGGQQQTATFSTFAAPAALSSGGTGIAGGEFTPTGGSSALSQVVISVSVPAAVSGSLVVTQCPGTSATSGQTATCTVKNLAQGTTAQLEFTFTAATVSSPTAATVSGTATFDSGKGMYAGAMQTYGGGGGKGGGSKTTTISANPAGTFTVYPSGGTFAGTCSPLSSTSNSLTASDPTTGKSVQLSYGTAGTSSGLPCTPASRGVDPSITIPTFTQGIWTLQVAPLANGGLAHATLTVAKLPWPTIWLTAKLNEIIGDPTNNPTIVRVPLCRFGGALPAGSDACLVAQLPYNWGFGVQFFVNFAGNESVDPRFNN